MTSFFALHSKHCIVSYPLDIPSLISWSVKEATFYLGKSDVLDHTGIVHMTIVCAGCLEV